MQVFRGIDTITESVRPSVVTIGNFDGVHLGHQSIIERARARAREIGGPCIAYTFKPHPQAILRPEIPLSLLSTYEEKLRLLSQLGVDVVIEEPFSRDFSNLGSDGFFKQILLNSLNCRAVVVGYDFAFGRQREGSLDELQTFCEQAGVELQIIPALKLQGEAVSSSRIRQHLLAGDMRAASRLLGRNFSYRGVVSRGEGRGRKLGFPTANLKLESKLALPYGVYVTWATLDGQLRPSVTNIGVRPTFAPTSGELAALVETHLLDESGDFYGKEMEVAFVERLRGEQKFAGGAALKAQITCDVVEARRVLGAG